MEYRESYVINSRYGLNGTEKKRLKELGKELNVSCERVRTIQRQIICKLRRTYYLNQYYYNLPECGEKTDENQAIIDFLKPEEQEIIRNLISEIDNSNVVYYNRKIEIPQEIIQDEKITNGIKFLKRINELINERRKNKSEIINKKIESKPNASNKIENLNLSVQTLRSLKRAGVVTLADLCKMTLADVYKIRNIGKKSCEEIVETLREYNLALRSEDDIEFAKGLGIIDGDNCQVAIENEPNGEDTIKEESIEEDKTLIQDYFDLPVAIYHSLLRRNVNTVGDIKKLKIEDLYKMKGMGCRRCEKLISILSEKGIELKSEKEKNKTTNDEQVKMMTILESMKKRKEDLQRQAKYLEEKIHQAEKLLGKYKESNEKSSNENKNIGEND